MPLFKGARVSPGVVALAFNPSTKKTEAGGSLEFKVSLVYRVSSWLASVHF